MKPGQKFKRAEKSSFQYKLITGILICSTLLGLFFCGVYFKDMNYMFWLYVIWTLFFAMATYCWLDDERYEKFERVMTPVLFGLLGLLAAFAGIGCLIFNASRFFRGEGNAGNLIGGMIGAASCAAMAYFVYLFYIKDHLKPRG